MFTGGQPSNAFCLLLRLLTLRCSEKQMKLLLDHVDSPYIRGIGFLYLRFAGEPTAIWGWIESHLYDDEPITVAATSSKNKARQGQRPKKKETIGDFVRRLFSSERDFYGTMLPRLPIQVERDLQVKLLFAEKIQERAGKHLSNRKTMDYFKTLGSRVMALYGDDDNPVTWYEGVVDRVVLRDEGSSGQLAVPKFVVTFPEYGNTETVALGEMEMFGVAPDSVNKEKPAREERRGYGDRHHGGYDRGYDRGGRKDSERREYSNAGYQDGVDSRRGGNEPLREYHNGDGHRRRDNESRRGYNDVNNRDRRDNGSGRGYADSYSTSQSAAQLPSGDDLYEEVRRRERANVIAKGRQDVARRPPNAKASLTDPHRNNRYGSENSHVPLNRENAFNIERNPSHSAPPLPESAPVSTATKRSTEDVAVQQEKKRKLTAKYG
jgi:pre-mRNA-splicing factor 38B